MTNPDDAPSRISAALDRISPTASLTEQKAAFAEQLRTLHEEERTGRREGWDAIARHAHPGDPEGAKKAPKVLAWFKGTSAPSDGNTLELVLKYLRATTEEIAAFRRASEQLDDRRKAEAEDRAHQLNRKKTASPAGSTTSSAARPDAEPATPEAADAHTPDAVDVPGTPAAQARTTHPPTSAERRPRHPLRWVLIASSGALAILMSVTLLNGNDPPANRPQAAEPSHTNTPRHTPSNASVPRPTPPTTSTASTARIQWTYPDGSHLAAVDNSGRGGWAWIDDRQADRHWAGIAFLLRGEPWSNTRDPARWHTYLDDNGANNGDRLPKPGTFATTDISAATICEGVGSDLDPRSCSPWKKLETD